MVVGLDKFKEAFADFKDNYVIIGGTACDIVLSDTDMRPRATDDIDMILVVEKMTKEYGGAFWQFIKDGEYKAGKREKDDKTPAYTLYRFTTEKEGYPVKIELLSRHSDILGEPSGFHIEPIPLSEDCNQRHRLLDLRPFPSQYRQGYRHHSLRLQPVRLCLPQRTSDIRQKQNNRN